MADSNQYTNSKVQPEDFTSGWMIALIITGLGVSLPVLYLGAEIALNLGFWDGMIAFGVSTAVLTTFATLNIEFPLWAIIVIGSIFITITTIYGIKTLEKLANIAVPILLVFLCYVVYIALGQTTDALDKILAYQAPADSMTLFEGTSALIGSSILVPVLMADFSRYIYNDKQSLLSVLGVTIGTPLVMVISTIIAIQTGEVDIIEIMKSFDLVIPAFILIFVSTWVTNATNLYSISLTFNTVVESLGYTKMCMIASVIGTIMALFGFSNYFIEFLNILGVLTPSIAAIYILDFFWLKKQRYELAEVQPWGIRALVSWGISSIIALLTYTEVFSLTGAYFVDSFLIAGMFYFLVNKNRRGTM